MIRFFRFDEGSTGGTTSGNRSVTVCSSCAVCWHLSQVIRCACAACCSRSPMAPRAYAPASSSNCWQSMSMLRFMVHLLAYTDKKRSETPFFLVHEKERHY